MLGRDRLAVVSAMALLLSLLLRTCFEVFLWLRRPPSSIDILLVGETVGMFFWGLMLIVFILVLSGWFRSGLLEPKHLSLFLTFLSAAMFVWFVVAWAEGLRISFELVWSVALLLTPPSLLIWVRRKAVSLPSKITPPSIAASFGKQVSLLVFWFAFYFLLSFWNLYCPEWASETGALLGRIMTVLGCISIAYASIQIFRQPASYCSDGVKDLVGAFSFCWATLVLHRLPRYLDYLTRTPPVPYHLLAWIDTALILGQAISLLGLCASLISAGTLHRLVDVPSRLVRNLTGSLSD